MGFDKSSGYGRSTSFGSGLDGMGGIITTKTSLLNQNILDPSQTPDNKPLDVFSFTNQKLYIEQLPDVPTIDVNKPCDRPVDPTKAEENNAALRQTYCDTCNQIKEQIIDAVDQVDKGVAKGLRNSVPAPSSSMASEVAESLIPGMDVYTFINAVTAKSANPENPKVAAAIDQALNNLSKANDGRKAIIAESSQPKTSPTQFNFENKTPKQIIDFVKTPPEEHEFLKDLDKADIKIARMRDNLNNYDNHYTDKVTPEKIQYAVSKGDNATIEKLLKGDETKVMLAKAGNTKVAEPGELKFTFREATYVSQAVFEGLKGLQPDASDVASFVQTKKLSETFNREPKNVAALTLNTQPSLV